MNYDYIVDLIVDAILSDIDRCTDEWADPTGDKAVSICEISQNGIFEKTK